MQNPETGGKQKAQGLALVAGVGLLGMIFVVWPGARPGTIPGDLHDGRFCSYMLEHFYRWITGREPGGFWNAPFFYPFPWVTAFSENFSGTGPVYSLFRWAGLDREEAFRWWYLAGFAANYAACAYVLMKFRLRALAVAAGAFIFTFNMAAVWHSGHVQLLYRCGIPLAVFYFYRALRERRLMDWVWCLFWLVWQCYAGMYTGIFLGMLLAAFGAGIAVVNVPGRLRAGEGLREIFIAPAAAAWRDAGAARRVAAPAGFIALAWAAWALFHPYAQAAALYRFQMPWWLVYKMLPRPWSYLYSANSLIWPGDWKIFRSLEYSNEHEMFTGAAVWALCALTLAGMTRGWAREWRKPLLLPLALAVGFLAGVTLLAFHFTLYRLVFALPGMDAIRAVTRIIVALLFPVAVVCAFGVDALLERAREGKGGAPAAIKAGLAVLLAGLALEAVLIRHYSVPKAVCQSRLEAMQAAITAMGLPPAQQGGMGNALPRTVIIVPERTDTPGSLTELDAMMLAQQNGFATLNGYSGNLPPGVPLNVNAAGGADRIAAYFKFFGPPDEARERALAARVLVWNGSGFEPMQWPAEGEK